MASFGSVPGPEGGLTHYQARDIFAVDWLVGGAANVPGEG
jgi:hypothetical protein